MAIIHHDKPRRQDLLSFISNRNGVGIELGVAEGAFSEMILQEFQEDDFYLYSVDMWAGDRGHDNQEYRKTIQRLSPWKHKNSIIRLPFDDALDLFPDGHFEFVYVDGYAHTGEADGKYFRDWWPKVKPGGIMAGDDYHTDWPRVIPAVTSFASEIGREVNIIPNTEKSNKWSLYPSWFVYK